MRRLTVAGGLVALIGLLAPATSYAQQTVTFYVGGIETPDYHGRQNNDVLLNNTDFLAFHLGEFAGPTVGGEYMFGLGEYIDAGAGVGYYSQTIPSVYAYYVNSDGSEIRQDLGLRMTPITATFRVIPFGRSAPVQPYFGAGVGIINWRYSESGEFVDYTDGSIFRDTFKSTGTAVGPVILGGLRVMLGQWGVGGEVRWQDAKGDLPTNMGYAGTTVDLSGWNYLATVSVHF
jgi:hypothetical protein